MLKCYEILFPLMYNDGSPIEPEKFDQTRDELIKKFGAITADTFNATGHWLYKGVLYKDKLMRYRVDVAEDPGVRKFFEEYKKILEKRFSQIDIWITVTNIEII
ncbi:MAG: hypothetical protein ACUZ77_10640 [Candidatus Brocadiales bacterium]